MQDTKTIFITGASGFIGSHLMIDLFNKGFHVIGGDVNTVPNPILLDFKEKMILEDRASELEERMNLYVMDFTKMTKKQVLAFEVVDLIYHLASPIGVNNVTSHPNETFREAMEINRNIDMISTQFIIPVVYASSSEVFGSGTITEDTIYSIKKLEDSNRWTYAAAKLNAEFLFGTGHYSSTVVRFFNVSGPGQSTPGMVIPEFIKNAKLNNDLNIIQNGTRTFCDIRDAIDQIVPIGIDLMENLQQSKYEGKSYNIGSTNPANTMSIKVLAKIIIDVFNSDSNIITHDDGETGLIPVRILESVSEDLDFDINNYSVPELIGSIFEYEEIGESDEEGE